MKGIDELPKAFVEKLPLFIPAEKQEEVFASFLQEKPISFRVNTLKIASQECFTLLEKENISFERVSWYPDAGILKTAKEILMQSDVYTRGFVYIQNLSSMIPVLVVDPQEDDLILDMCASPGSKTSQLACLMNNNGTIIANDKSRARIFKLKANLATQGVTNTSVIQRDGEMLWKIYPEYFDKVLVDAPCSMEGRFLAGDSSTYEDWAPKKVKYLSHMQKYLLRSAVSATKSGGTIIYSTCTMSPEENEEVIDWICDKEQDAITVEKIMGGFPYTTLGITSWKHKTYDPSVANTLRILPSSMMEGFFVAKIKKHRSTVLR